MMQEPFRSLSVAFLIRLCLLISVTESKNGSKTCNGGETYVWKSAVEVQCQ